MLQATTLITAAQLLDPHNPYYPLLPPAPAGSFYIIFGIASSYRFGTTQYTGYNELNIQITTPISQFTLVELQDITLWTTNEAETWLSMIPSYTAYDAEAIPFEAIGLTIKNESEGALASGDGDLNITVFYALAPL
jgi:hypothetical protein